MHMFEIRCWMSLDNPLGIKPPTFVVSGICEIGISDLFGLAAAEAWSGPLALQAQWSLITNMHLLKQFRISLKVI